MIRCTPIGLDCLRRAFPLTAVAVFAVRVAAQELPAPGDGNAAAPSIPRATAAQQAAVVALVQRAAALTAAATTAREALVAASWEFPARPAELTTKAVTLAAAESALAMARAAELEKLQDSADRLTVDQLRAWAQPGRAATAAGLAPAAAGAAGSRYEMAILWTQTAGEWRALFYQGFNLARLRLDEALRQPRDKPPAIVTDVDETIIDNSPYYARVVLGPPEQVPPWSDWTERGIAEATPGALDFLQYAVSRGVDIFYVTNRTQRERAATMANLKRLNFPMIDDAHMLLPPAGSKEVRRAQLAQKYDLLLFLGDNLGDFAEFNGRPFPERNRRVDDSRDEFSRRFIVFPNTFVGDWVGAANRSPRGGGGTDRGEVLRSSLRSYP